MPVSVKPPDIFLACHVGVGEDKQLKVSILDSFKMVFFGGRVLTQCYPPFLTATFDPLRVGNELTVNGVDIAHVDHPHPFLSEGSRNYEPSYRTIQEEGRDSGIRLLLSLARWHSETL